jgi:hypothetical protein
MNSHRTGGLIGAVFVASACAPSQTPAAMAEAVARLQCDREAIAQEVPLVRWAAILRVEPLYSHVATSNNNSEERVSGVKLLVRPPRGVSVEQMTRVLQCHSARVVLGRIDPNTVPNNPYWLPDAWVHIDVKSEDGNFAIVVSADSVRENIELLGRASRYAKEHALVGDPSVP